MLRDEEKAWPDDAKWLEVKLRINPRSATAKSKFLDDIIEQRKAGKTLSEISKWLAEKGEILTQPTLHRNLAPAADLIPKAVPFTREQRQAKVNEVVAKEQAQELLQPLDIKMELAEQIRVQKRRLHRLCKQEEQRQDPLEFVYHDRRIRSELELFNEMARNFYAMEVEESQVEALRADRDALFPDEFKLSKEMEESLIEVILKGELPRPLSDGKPN